MAFTDQPLEELAHITASVHDPADFDEFWNATMSEARALDQGFQRKSFDALPAFHVEDIQFSGFGGEPIAAWFIRARGATGPLPLVVEYNGYGGGRGLPHEWLRWPAAGYAYAIMDTRGQGAWWGSGGHTPDPHGHGASAPGFATRGLERPEDLYYRRVFTDAARLVETLCGWDEVDEHRVTVTGTSQGGGIAIAAAALVPAVAAALPDVPFGCWWQWSLEHTDEDPYAEVRRYFGVHHDLVETALRSLDYIDAVNFARRSRCPALFSVGLMDPVCLPSTVFGTRNAWQGPSEIAVYPHNGHEGGGGRHFYRQVSYLESIFGHPGA